MVYPRSEQSHNAVSSGYDRTHSRTNQTKIASNGGLRYFHDRSFHRAANYRSAYRIATTWGLILMAWFIPLWGEKMLYEGTALECSVRDELGSDALADVQQQPGLTM